MDTSSRDRGGPLTKAAALKSLVLIASLCLCALPLSADGPQTGTIDGRVLDAQGGGLPGATVTLKGPQRTTTVMSDAGGKYRFALLQAGDFTVTAELEGLGSAEQTVGLTPGQRRGVDLTLAGGAAEEITVTGEAAQISKYDTGSVSSLQSEANENIAFANRNYAASVRALPGVVSAGESDALPMINGGITTETQVLIEGVDTSNTRRGGETRVIMPTSSLSETRIESGGFGAEYGRVTGGIINSTVKTGTNEFHGDFLYIGQNPKWRAEDNLGLERPDDPFASFETSLGGPIWREKAWFFAAYADFTNNSLDELRDGTVIDDSRTSEPRILKVNLQPSDRHQLAITEIDSRGNGIANPGNSGDLLSVMDRPLYAQVLTGTWSFAATSSTFVEVKASERKDLFPRTLLFPKDPSTLNPDASDNPVDNNFRYRDLNTNLRWNGPASGSGIGYNDFPRDTLGGSATLFKANHELKFGIDFQDIEFTNLGQVGKEYRGRTYCFECPGGYVAPQRVRIFEDSEPSRNTGEELSVYAQDRIDVGDKWSFHLGVRLDEERMWNDVGRQVDDSSDVAPRLTAVYDVKADGKLLVRASVGSYYQNLGLDFAFREFSELPTGQQAFTEYNWNPATQRYDRFRTTVAPSGAGGEIQMVDHARRDQITVGVDVQLSRNWVFKGGLVAHETDGIPFGNTQYLGGTPGHRFRDRLRYPRRGTRRESATGLLHPQPVGDVLFPDQGSGGGGARLRGFQHHREGRSAPGQLARGPDGCLLGQLVAAAS